MKKKSIIHQNLERENSTWFFFPIYGLHIKESKEWREFLFGDSTIANSIDIRKYLNMTTGIKFDKKNIVYDFPDDQSYIIVSIDGPLNKDTQNEIIESAKIRANQIAGLIYTYFAYTSYYRYAITLGNEVYHPSGSSFKYISSNRSWGDFKKSSKNEFLIRLPENNFIYSRKGLLSELRKAPFYDIFKIVVFNEDHFKEVSNSLVNFYITSNVPSASTQQLGAVTSIELLLKDSEKYEQIEKRIKVLLGEDIFNGFISNSSDGVLKKRHSIIHQGSICNRNDSFRAIELYCYVLLSYCKICNRFSSKEEFCFYLDMIYKYKYSDNFRKHDTFRLLGHFEKTRLEIGFNEWLTRKLINWFSICNPESKEIENDNFIKLIHYMHKSGNLDLEKSYKLITYGIYYHKLPCSAYNEFEREYTVKINSLLDKFDDEIIDSLRLSK